MLILGAPLMVMFLQSWNDESIIAFGHGLPGKTYGCVGWRVGLVARA